MITEATLASFMAALFSMMNPVANVGVFAGMTLNRPEHEVRRIAWTCAVAVVITLLVVAWSGSLLLQFFGITVDSLRAAGGLIILLIGLVVIGFGNEHTRRLASTSILAGGRSSLSETQTVTCR